MWSAATCRPPRSTDKRAQNHGALGAQISAWRRTLEQAWPALRFGRVSVDTRGDRHHFTVEVMLGALAPHAVRVELYADASGEEPAFRHEMARLEGRADDSGMNLYEASVPAARAAGDYTARIVPSYPGVHVPLEAPYVLWQR